MNGLILLETFFLFAGSVDAKTQPRGPYFFGLRPSWSTTAHLRPGNKFPDTIDEVISGQPQILRTLHRGEGFMSHFQTSFWRGALALELPSM